MTTISPLPAKSPKTPTLSTSTKLLCFDLETNGLHGEAFAIGAVVMDMDAKIHDQFTARTRLTSKVDPWVKDNVLPAIVDMPITHKNYQEMCEAFWTWYLKAEPESDYVVVKNGYPVEYRFLLDCQKVDLENRYWQHPFPILDLSSLLIQVGYKSQLSKADLLKNIPNAASYQLHNPLNDAKLTAVTAFEAFRLAGRLG